MTTRNPRILMTNKHREFQQQIENLKEMYELTNTQIYQLMLEFIVDGENSLEFINYVIYYIRKYRPFLQEMEDDVV